jgi:hypothetical protein
MADWGPGDEILHYVILRRLDGGDEGDGKGGFSSVYLARHRVTSERFALKVPQAHIAASPALLGRFIQEGVILKDNPHPHIIPIHDVYDKPPLLAMPFLDGEDLEALLGRAGRIGLSLAVTWTLDVLSALTLVHGKGIVHRDIKPANLFLERLAGRPNIRILDFGIAKAPGGQTRTNARFGTMQYWSPEQAESTRDVDGRTDLFSLGVTLYEMVSGQAFGWVANLTGRYPSLVELLNEPGLADLDALLQKATAPDPEARFQTTLEFADALHAFQASSTPEPPAPTPVRAAPTLTPRRTIAEPAALDRAALSRAAPESVTIAPVTIAPVTIAPVTMLPPWTEPPEEPEPLWTEPRRSRLPGIALGALLLLGGALGMGRMMSREPAAIAEPASIEAVEPAGEPTGEPAEATAAAEPPEPASASVPPAAAAPVAVAALSASQSPPTTASVRQTTSPDPIPADDKHTSTDAPERSAIDAVLLASQDRIAACHADRLAERPGLTGRVVVEVAIGQAGQAIRVDVVESTLEDVVVESCLRALLSGLRWPPPGEAGVTVVRYPLQFSPVPADTP